MMPQVTKFRVVALPPEHGGWALIIEPIVLGLLVAPSTAGLFISLAALACFLARHPIKVAIGDRRRKRLLHRTSLANRFALLYVTLAVVFFATAVGITADREFLLPLVVALPLILIQLLYDVRGQSRKAIPEILGALAVGSISAAIALAAGWSKATAYALWIIIACRHVPTILYLRVLLNRRRQKERAMADGPVIVVQVLALMAIIVLLFFKIAPTLAIVVFAILFTRAVVGLFNHRPLTPKQLGISEIIFGAFAVLMVSAGYLLGW